MNILGISLVWLLVFGALVAPNQISSVFAVQSIPLAPTQLNATAVSGTQIFLIWNPPLNASQSGVTGYKIEVDPSCVNSFRSLVNTTGTSFVSSGLTNGTCYQFRVESVNSVGFSPASNTASAFTLSAPSAPTNLSALAISPSQINLRWTVPGNIGGTAIKGYEIQRENSCTGSFVIIRNTTNSSTTYSDIGLDANTCYQYKVLAINAIGSSSASNIATATTLPSVTQIHVPSAPTGLVVTTVSNTSLKLTWNTPVDNGGSPITGYLVQRNGTVIVNNTFSNNTSYVDTNLLHSHLQTYQVAAWNSVGKSPVSNSAIGVTGVTIVSTNSTNQTSNLGQLVSNLIHERNQLLQQQRQEIVTIIHDCHDKIKNSPMNKKQIQEDCKVKIQQIKAKYKDLRKQLNNEIKAVKSQFQEIKHDEEEKQSLKEHDHPENETKISQKDSLHTIKQKHLEIHNHDNSTKHKNRHFEQD